MRAQSLLTWNTMSPPSSMTAGRMRVSSSSLIMATTSLSSSEMAVDDAWAAGSVNSGSPERHRNSSAPHLSQAGQAARQASAALWIRLKS